MENENTASSTTSNYRLPSDLTMQHITKIGIVNDKPIMLDYWTKSLNNEIIKLQDASITNQVSLTA